MTKFFLEVKIICFSEAINYQIDGLKNNNKLSHFKYY